jgi:hypothetical protein
VKRAFEDLSGRIVKLGAINVTNSAGGGNGTLCTQLKLGVNQKGSPVAVR